MALEVINILGILSAIIIIGFLAELLFKKTKIPDVIFLIIIGIILGPLLSLASKESFGTEARIFTTFTLLFLLFQGALNIEFRNLFRSLKGTLKLTLISFILTAGIVALISFYILNYPLTLSILIGAMLGGTSSVVVIPLVKNISINKKFGDILTLESALTDVLCIVFVITMFTVILGGDVSTTEIVKSILTSFSLAIIIGIAGAMIWIFLLSKSKILLDAHMVTIAWVIAIYAFVESSFVGASGAIAALAFGLVLGNSGTFLRFFNWVSKGDKEKTKKKWENQDSFLQETVLPEKAQSFYSEISFFVKVFFFVYLGIVFDFTNPKVFIFGGVITFGIFFVRYIAVKLSFWNDKIDKNTKNALRSMAPKGIASAVLASLAIEKGIPQAAEITSLILSVILVSITLTSILIFFTQKNTSPNKEISSEEKKEIEEEQESE